MENLVLDLVHVLQSLLDKPFVKEITKLFINCFHVRQRNDGCMSEEIPGKFIKAKVDTYKRGEQMITGNSNDSNA